MVMLDLGFDGMAENKIIVQHAGKTDQDNYSSGPGEFFTH